MSLTNNYTDYDYLFVYFGYNTTVEDTSIKNIGLFDCSSPYNNFEYVFNSRVNSSTVSTVYADISFSGVTWKINKYLTTISDVFISKIVGIKFLPNPNNYSTTEKEIGTWIDGKKLYQRTFTGTTGSGNSGASIDCTALGIDNCIEINGYIQNTNGGFVPVNYNNNTVYTATSLGADKIIYLIVNGDVFNNCPYNITIKYTKV